MRLSTAPLAVAVALTAVPADACYPCSFWQTWGQRALVCGAPSEGLLTAALACWCFGPCGVSCAAWCASYAACSAVGDPTCQPTGATPDCDACVYDVGLGCGAETYACSADRTGCAVGCASWLAGSPVCDSDTPEAVALSDCACSGPCAAECSASCGLGYFDTSGYVSGKCAHCTTKTKGCAAEYGACLDG